MGVWLKKFKFVDLVLMISAYTLDAHKLSEFQRGTPHLNELGHKSSDICFRHDDRRPFLCSS